MINGSTVCGISKEQQKERLLCFLLSFDYVPLPTHREKKEQERWKEEPLLANVLCPLRRGRVWTHIRRQKKSWATSRTIFSLCLSPTPPPQTTYILMVLDLIWSEGHLTVFTGFITSRGGHLFCIITAVTYFLCQRVGVSKHLDRVKVSKHPAMMGVSKHRDRVKV